MRNKTLFGFSFLSFICLLQSLFLLSCDNGTDCNINNVAYNHIGFYSTNNPDTAYTFPDTLSVLLSINSKDSIIVNRSTKTSTLQLPMCYTQTIDTLIFKYTSGIRDSLFIGHTNIPFFISMDCGMAMYHQITEVKHTYNFIDSISIPYSYVNFDGNENIKLFFNE